MKRAANDVPLKASKKTKIDLNEQNAGKLHSFTIRNFMCHENFEFQFGPRMNFIIGENGSGKSAILTALILVLGGTSKTTGRFSNIKEFIMTGKQKAKLELVLHNCGEEAYRPELYGKKITVTREFTVSGSNQYKLITEEGNIVASNKEELTNILSALDIHVDNPVQVLTQEISRTFLSKHSKGNELYEFFLQGTSLKTLEDSYNDVKFTKNEAEQTLESKLQALSEIRKELDQWKRFLDSSIMIEDYKKELIWAGIIKMEKIVKEKKDECEKVENELKNKKEEMDKCKALLDTKTKELDEYTKKRTDCSVFLSEYQDKVLKRKRDYETCITSLRKHEGSLALYTREEENISNDIHNLSNSINESLQKTQIDLEEEERKQLAEVDRLQQENLDFSKNLDQLQKSKNLMMEVQEQTKPKIENLIAELSSFDYNEIRIKENINNVEVALKNKANVFGPFTQEVLNEISARKNEFRKLPIGPIGMHVEVKDPKWIRAIEKCVSRPLLCSYCVDNHEDDLILQDILSKHCSDMPSTILCPFSNEMYDVSPYKAQTDFPTVLDMLDFNDVQVANALIEHAQIENKILIEDIRTGQDIMLSNPPKNCEGAFMMNGDQILLDPYRYYSDTNPYSNLILSSEQKNEIIKLNECLNQLLSESITKKEEKCILERRIESIPSKIKDLESQIAHFSMMHRDNCEKLKDLNCEKNTEDVNVLQEELQSLQEEHRKKKTSLEESQKEVSKHKQEKEEIIKENEELKALLLAKKEEYNELTTQIKKCSLEKETLSTAEIFFRDEVKALEKKLQGLNKTLESEKRKTELATQNAEKVCARIDTENDCDSIQRMIAETQKVVEEYSNCDKSEICEKYIERFQRCKEAEGELRHLRSYLTRLDAMLAVRFKKFKDILVHTRTVVDLSFISILYRNEYNGALGFDDKKRTLKLEAAPRQGQSSKLKNSFLSGGERSFVTIAFLLALWERTRMPFRVLDEYDVFMDSNNRQLSVELLIHKAEEMDSTQFIFLSPLDIPLISHPENVKIHKLLPPKRIDNTSVSPAE